MANPHSTLIDQWYIALRKADAVALATITSPDVTIWWGTTQRDVVPWAGLHNGQEGVRAFAAAMAGTVITRQIDITDTFATADRCVVTYTGRWTVPTTQMDLMARQTDIFRVASGKIAACECYADTAGFGLLLGKLKR
jgi:ketosteroid isomerase-like protein